MAPELGTNGAYIRDVAPNYSYREDIVNEVHQDGLIFAGDGMGLVASIAW